MGSMFTCKTRIVSCVHKAAPPFSITYSSVVTRESVRRAFIIAGLNNLDIFACGIVNAYLHAPCQGKLWTKSGS